MLAGRSIKGTKEACKLTQINANGTVIHFVRHFELSVRFWWKRRMREGRRGTWGFGERNSPTLNKFEGPMNFFLPSGATMWAAEVPLH
jgi:hypothetical protein